jgi:topoisomerase-4 subunit A
LRLNYDGRGEYIGEFQSDESILIITKDGRFYTTNFDLSNHYNDDVNIVEKFDPDKIWTAALYDADQQNYPYLKRFPLEASLKPQSFLGDNPESKLILLTEVVYPRIELVFGGGDSFREKLVLDGDEFIGVKSFKAKGKRLSTYTVESINELEPIRFPEEKQASDPEEPIEVDIEDEDAGKPVTDIVDEIIGQGKLFD